MPDSAYPHDEITPNSFRRTSTRVPKDRILTGDDPTAAQWLVQGWDCSAPLTPTPLQDDELALRRLKRHAA